MRYFESIHEAIAEIRRDLSKAPEFVSHRVQQFDDKDLPVHEGMVYAYTIPSGGIPDTASILVGIGAQHFPVWSKHHDQLTNWIADQATERINAALHGLIPRHPADSRHPVLGELREGGDYSYIYADRLSGMAGAVTAALNADHGTRRAYWPIYDRTDSRRAIRASRIPCTLGYHFMIREVPGVGELMHMTIVQRSVDFDLFWLTDLYLSYRLLSVIAGAVGVPPGNISHVILSFHRFDREGEEIY